MICILFTGKTKKQTNINNINEVLYRTSLGKVNDL